MGNAATYDSHRSQPSSFVSEHPRYDRMFAGVGAALLRALDPRPGERVLDVGCGAGSMTLTIACGIGERGEAVGIDTNLHAIDLARQRANHMGLSRASFLVGDATSMSHAQPFDAIVSRFGSIHFPDPVAGYANLRSALGPDGRLAFACARELERNEWAYLPLKTIASASSASPRAGKGPFAFSDGERIRDVLVTAGFGDVELTSVDEPVWVGESVDDAVDFFWRTDGRPLARALEPDSIDAIERGLVAALSTRTSIRGVELGASMWIVTARA